MVLREAGRKGQRRMSGGESNRTRLPKIEKNK